MKNKVISNEIENIRNVLKEANKSYHIDDAAIMPDHEYDQLLRKLRDLEASINEEIPASSPTQTVGAKTSGRFGKFVHNQAMLSLANAFSDQDMHDFNERILKTLKEAKKINEATKSLTYIAEFKMDGLAVALHYKNGYLVSAATRGDGQTGEDVTKNIQMIKDIPHVLKNCSIKSLEIRGEVYMRKNILEKINKKRENNGEEPLANVRNAAAGTLRQLDPEIVRERELSFIPYTLIDHEESFFSQNQALEQVVHWGFHEPGLYRPIEGIKNIISCIKKWEFERDNLPYEIDGIVVKVDNLSLHSLLGTTSKDPKWGIAYKFKPRSGKTRLTDIIVTVGRTGILTPNAVLEQVSVGGTRVSAATLHNVDYIREKDIRIGDIVEVIRAGDVIPRVERVFVDERTGKEKIWSMPKKCPACQGPVEKENIAYRCQGTTCPAQIIERLSHFASRDAMDIDGFGDAVAILWATKIQNIAEVFEDTNQQFDTLGFKGKQRENLVKSLAASKDRGLGRVLYGLGIANVGKKTAMDLAQHFGNIEELISASNKDLIAIDGIGTIVAHAVHTFFSDIKNLQTIQRLQKAGVRLEEYKLEKDTNALLTGLQFVITGTLPTMNRDEVSHLIEKHGGIVSNSLSKKTTYLLAGESAGSKMTKAKSFGTTIIDEKIFLKMIQKI